MGWKKFNESVDKYVVPQKEDSVGTMIAKAICAPFAAPICLLDLFEPEEDNSSSGASHDGNRSGGCHCDCDSHRR